MRAVVSVALILSMCAGCAPAFDRGAKPQQEFDRDNAQCLEENTTKSAARYGPSRHTNWDSYALCMTSKGYPRR